MNERIKELAKEAGLEGDNGHYEYDWFNPEKFAELIVRECLMKATGAMIRKESIKELIVNIAEDFGIDQ